MGVGGEKEREGRRERDGEMERDRDIFFMYKMM